MSTDETQWILCPVCYRKTQTQNPQGHGFTKLNMKSSQTPRRRAESDEKSDSLCVILFQRIEGEHKQ